MSDTTSPSLNAYLAPRYWGTWIALGIMRLLAILPYPLQYLCGHGIGLIIWLLPLPQKRIIRINLTTCFADKTTNEINRLAFKNCLSMGMSLVEVAMSWWSSDRALRKRVQIEGLNHLEAALKHGHGVILLGAHFTTLEIGGRLLRLQHPFYVMQRDQKNRLFNAIMTRARIRNYQKAIHRNNIKQLLRSLKENMPVWYAPDQHFGGANNVVAPFFNIPAPTNPATSRIARISHTKVVPFFQQRLPGLQGYRLILFPALEHYPTDDIEQDTARINEELEKLIRMQPEQYLWAHRRFKGQPGEHGNIYTTE